MTRKKHFRTYLPKILGGILLIVVLGLMVYFVTSLKGGKAEKKEKKPQQVTLVKPPPPPPPPPKVEKPPEPPKEKIEEPVPEPEPEPEEPVPDVEEAPPGEDLGLDAEGGAGSDGFGLVGRKGGRGLFGGGGGGSPFARYGKMAANEIRDVLSENEKLRRKGYTAVGKLWLEPDGTVKKIELARGSNDSDIDELLVRTLNKLKKINEPPPSTMEQPIKFKITVRL